MLLLRTVAVRETAATSTGWEGRKHLTLTTLLVKLIKTGAKVVRHSKYVTFQMAEVAVPRKVFAAILTRLRQWAAKARAGPVPAVT